MKKLLGSQQSEMKAPTPARKMRGFSLVEMMIVVAIGLIMAGITFISLQPALQDAHINNAYDTALTQLRVGRERAIAERARYIVAFGANVPPLAAAGVPAPDAQSIQLWRWAVATPVSPPPALINSVELPHDVKFQAVAGLPNPGPDNWGTGGVALDFDQGVGVGGLTYVMFMPDGSSQDELGNSNSGVLYLSRAATLASSKAVTVFGTTGRVRGWRLNGAAWIEQ
jgi:prepilin-type N-terminal cleavage/methylation domain-containing protein